MRKYFIITIALFSLIACTNEALPEQVNENNQNKEVSSEVSYETIELDEIDDYVADGYIVVDVREPDEFASGHIPNAINLPLTKLQMGDVEPLEQDKSYIIICRSGNRSVTASNILTDFGFDVVNVREGMSTWTGEIEK